MMTIESVGSPFHWSPGLALLLLLTTLIAWGRLLRKEWEDVREEGADGQG